MEIVPLNLKVHDYKKVAELIYNTEVELFGLIFGFNKNKAIPLIESCIKLKHNTFSYRFVKVSLENNKVTGIMITHRGGEVKKLLEDEDFIKVIKFFESFKLWFYDKFFIERILTRSSDPSDYYISNLCVDKDYRKKGIGSAFLKSALESAKNLGCQRVILDVSINNPQARKLYEGKNFKVYQTKKASFFGKKAGTFCMEQLIVSSKN
ncbi:MAG: GNAT family N-acetyltransferase [Patescibacteria group bacterium]|jgi:ribosomal protein S18 acetylase RimI-like enzyme